MVESWEEERGGTAAGGAGAGPSSLAAGREGGAAVAGGRGGSACAEQNPQRRQRRRVIRWERFLPRRSLRVLLVEPDDSTRHIVTALLRKCSYNVVSAADGLKAWDVLKKRNYSFDLVLSEVEIPSLAGISLLSKIMANELTKNIPVIMMSSRDSVSIVFRCMHKGAVDFLVKPIRINELRNLWQHVWRRHCSTNLTNGPETMANNQTVSENMSDNGTSNDVSANMGKGSNNNESDGGDDQSSRSKLPMENVRPEHQGPIMDRDSTKVIKSQPQHINDSISTSDDALSNHADIEMKGKTWGVTVSSVKETPMSDKVQEQLLDAKSLSTGRGLDPIRDACVDASHSSSLQKVVCKSPEGLIDFIGSDVKGQCSFSSIDNHREREAGICGSRRSSSIINTFTADPSPSWELSLRRPLNGCLKNGFHKKNVLNHSPASAFSRYANSGICMQVQKSDSSLANIYISGGGSADVCQPQLDSPGTVIERPIPFIPNGKSLHFQRNKEFMVYHKISSSNDEDTESLASAQKEETQTGCRGSKPHPGFPHSHFGVMSLSMPAGATPFQGFSSGSNYGPILQPVFYNDSSASPHGYTSIKQGKCLSSDQPANDCNHVNVAFLSTEVGSYEEGYDPRLLEVRATESTVNVAPVDPRFRLHICGDEERAEQSVRYNVEIINTDGRKENGRTAGAFVTTNSAFGLRSLNGALIYGGGKGVDQPHSHREAALIKFRMKRKDRCFEKKVRYHSRKMLAEQRPRVKGQFVRQTVADPAGTASDVDY